MVSVSVVIVIVGFLSVYSDINLSSAIGCCMARISVATEVSRIGVRLGVDVRDVRSVILIGV